VDGAGYPSRSGVWVLVMNHLTIFVRDVLMGALRVSEPLSPFMINQELQPISEESGF
jgi:hypothetical protein